MATYTAQFPDGTTTRIRRVFGHWEMPIINGDGMVTTTLLTNTLLDMKYHVQSMGGTVKTVKTPRPKREGHRGCIVRGSDGVLRMRIDW